MNAKVPTVLYVEDDAHDRVLLQSACNEAKLSLNVMPVRDGEEAIAYLQGEGIYSNRERFPFPDMVLLDLKLPRKSGFEVLELIQEHWATAELPVVVLSGSCQQCDTQRAFKSGATSYFEKPASLDQLVELARKIFSKWA